MATSQGSIYARAILDTTNYNKGTESLKKSNDEFAKSAQKAFDPVVVDEFNESVKANNEQIKKNENTLKGLNDKLGLLNAKLKTVKEGSTAFKMLQKSIEKTKVSITGLEKAQGKLNKKFATISTLKDK